MLDMKFDCSYDELVSLEKIVPHPDNNNQHSIEQLEYFARVLKAKKVWRQPLVISKRSGFLNSGHGRLDVARMIGLEKVPVNYQDFESEADEYQQMTFDNEIARWAKLDRHAVHLALEKIPELDADLLGIEKWNYEIEDEVDYSALDEASKDMDFGDLSQGVKKSIMIEFEASDYEAAYYLISEWRKKGLDIGGFLVAKLKEHQ